MLYIVQMVHSDLFIHLSLWSSYLYHCLPLAVSMQGCLYVLYHYGLFNVVPKKPALTCLISSRAHQYWGRGESQACSADWPKIIPLLASHPQNKDRPGDGRDLHHVPNAQAFRGSKTELQSMSRLCSQETIDWAYTHKSHYIFQTLFNGMCFRMNNSEKTHWLLR